MSSKSATSYLIVFLAVLLAILPLSNAIEEDFTAFSNNRELKVCACDLIQDKIYLSNTGAVTSTYQITNQGDAAAWATIAQDIFYLKTGESKEIDSFVKVPCDARGQYLLNTSVKTLFDTEKQITQIVDVANCANVNIIPLSRARKQCPCTPAEYEFYIINSGDHVETYDVSVTPKNDGITLSSDFLVLEPGEKQKITAFLSLDCGVYGQQTFTLNSKAKGTNMLAQLDFNMDIEKCYDYSIKSEKHYNVCNGIYNEVPITISNDALIGNNYDVKMTGPVWSWLINDTVSAWGAQTGTLKIGMVPEALAVNNTGYQIDLFAMSVRGDEGVNESLIVYPKNCHDYKLVFEKTAFNTIEGESKNHGVIIRNTGTKTSTYFVDAQGLEWANSNKDEALRLAPGQEQEIFVHTDAPLDFKGEYPFQIQVKYGEFPDLNQTTMHTMKVHTLADAYKLDISVPELDIGFNKTIVPVTFTNHGYFDSKYSLSLTASDWISIDQYYLNLRAGETEVINMTLDPADTIKEDTYAATINADVDGVQLGYANTFEVRLRPNSLWTKAKAFVTDYLLYLLIGLGVLVILIVLLIVLLVLRKKPESRPARKPKDSKKAGDKKDISIDQRSYKKQEKEKSNWKVPVIIILIALVVLSGAAVGVYYLMKSDVLDYFTAMGSNVSDNLTQVETAQAAPVQVAPAAPAADVLTEQDLTDPLIEIDRTGIAGSGSTLRLVNASSFVLPMTIQNPTDRKAIFNVKTGDQSWVSFEYDTLSIKPNSTQTIDVTVTPDLAVLEDNDYKISINSTLSGQKIQYQESLELTLTKRPGFWKSIWPFVILGLIILAVLIAVITMFARRERRPAKQKTKKSKKPKVVVASDGTWWKVLLIIFAIVICLAVIGGGAYFLSQKYAPFSGTNESDNDQAEIPTASDSDIVTKETAVEPLVSIDREDIAGRGNVLKIQGPVSIPISIKNPTDKKAIFSVKTSDSSWISFSSKVLQVAAGESMSVNMIISPDMEKLKENDYNVKVTSTISGEKINYEEQLDFVIKKKGFNWLWLLYILAGIVLLAIVIGIIELVKRREPKKPVKKTKPVKKQPEYKKSKTKLSLR